MAFKNPIVGEDTKTIKDNTDLEVTEPLENIRSDSVICELQKIRELLEKQNTYFAIWANHKL